MDFGFNQDEGGENGLLMVFAREGFGVFAWIRVIDVRPCRKYEN